MAAAVGTGTSVGGTSEGDVKRPFDFSASDLPTIVTTTAYVDKSLMIKDVYTASTRILITAPPRFGKSINLDMVKRFFEIEVDARGIPQAVHTTNNYKLFKDFNLEICKDIGFLNEHFGKYPVVHIDFKPLGGVDDPAKIFNAFTTIIENSFNQHRYILQYKQKDNLFTGITGFDANYFRIYVNGETSEDIDEDILANSFKHLSTILKRYFGKKVFVLIDGYDSFLDSLLIENNIDRKKLISFVQSSIRQLLNNVKCVDRVFITGVLPVIGEGLLCSENNIECYHFLDRHPFTKYYGLTNSEVDTVLTNVIECDEERRNVKNTLNDYYSAYETRNRDVRVFNVWSVLKYVCRRTVQSYWCDRRYINKFKNCFKINPIEQKIEELLLSNELQLDISQPLSMADVLKVNSVITSRKAQPVPIEVELFFILLHHFGYFSVIKENGYGKVCLRIPSIEIQYELVKATFDENSKLYKSPYVNDVLLDLDAFRPDATNLDQTFETFRKNMRKCYTNTALLFQKCLYVNSVTSGKYRRVMTSTLGPNGPTAVSLQNKHQVAICVAYGDDYQCAKIVHQKVTNDGGEEHIFEAFNDVRGKVIIAIGIVNEERGIAYSYYFKTGDNLQEPRTLSSQLVASRTKGNRTRRYGCSNGGRLSYASDSND